MKKSFMIGGSTIGIVLLLILVSMFLPKDFFGYYRDIDMVREELSGIYDNGVFVYTQETKNNRYTDFIINDDIYIVRIKEKDTIFGKKYRMTLKDRVFDFYDILERKTKEFNKSGEIDFVSIGWIDEWPGKVEENVLWSVLPVEYVITDLENNVSAHKFTYNGEDYVLYVKVEKVE